jgi:hypothetical protein
MGKRRRRTAHALSECAVRGLVYAHQVPSSTVCECREPIHRSCTQNGALRAALAPFWLAFKPSRNLYVGRNLRTGSVCKLSPVCRLGDTLTQFADRVSVCKSNDLETQFADCPLVAELAHRTICKLHQFAN